MVATLREHWPLLEGAFQSHHGLNLVTACFGPNEVGIRRLWSLIIDVPPSSPAGRAMGAWSQEDELSALGVEAVADVALSVRNLISLWMPKGKTYQADPALTIDRPHRPARPPSEPAEMTREGIDAAIRAALPRG